LQATDTAPAVHNTPSNRARTDSLVIGVRFGMFGPAMPTQRLGPGGSVWLRGQVRTGRRTASPRLVCRPRSIGVRWGSWPPSPPVGVVAVFVVVGPFEPDPPDRDLLLFGPPFTAGPSVLFIDRDVAHQVVPFFVVSNRGCQNDPQNRCPSRRSPITTTLWPSSDSWSHHSTTGRSSCWLWSHRVTADHPRLGVG
jgi:hypothetical protein